MCVCVRESMYENEPCSVRKISRVGSLQGNGSAGSFQQQLFVHDEAVQTEEDEVHFKI
jgi:hypothetical protein